MDERNGNTDGGQGKLPGTRLRTPEDARPPKQRRSAAEMAPDELAQKQAYDRLMQLKRRQRRREGRAIFKAWVGVDVLELMKRRKAETGEDPAETIARLPELLEAEAEAQRLKQQLRAEKANHEQTRNALHNLKSNRVGGR